MFQIAVDLLKVTSDNYQKLRQVYYKSKENVLHITAAQIFYYKLWQLMELLQITSKIYYKLRQVLQGHYYKLRRNK